MEILQMALLEPRFAILDETDSGLDIDALTDCRRWRQCAARPEPRFSRHHPLSAAFGLYRPDTVHVMAQGRIMRSGGTELALELERNGYRDYNVEGGGCLEGQCRMSAEMIHARTPAEIFLAIFSNVPRPRAGTPARQMARRHVSTFYAAGLPHRRIEAWHYTDLRTLIRDALPVADAA